MSQTATFISTSRNAIKMIKDELLKPQWPYVEHFDTYEAVCHRLGVQDTFHVWLHHGARAAVYLTKAEQAVTAELAGSKKGPRIILAHAPRCIDDAWKSYLKEKVSYLAYLQVSDVELYAELVALRQQHKKAANPACPSFGMWDNGVLTTAGRRSFRQLPRYDAQQKIQEHIQRFEAKWVEGIVPPSSILPVKMLQGLQFTMTASLTQMFEKLGMKQQLVQ